ncbi:hypothetical protein HK101_003581 [Irineochytrium annulatum]|nr:hypothetical protein HK101_003581 [Irineochytrium annulatum]
MARYTSAPRGTGDDVPAFKVVSSTKQLSLMYAANGVIQTALCLFVTSILSTTAIFSQYGPFNDDHTDMRMAHECLLYMDTISGSAPIGACTWPAVFAGACALAAMLMTAFDVHAVNKIYPPRSRNSHFITAAASAVCMLLMTLIGIQIAVGISQACANTASHQNGECRWFFKTMNSNVDLVGSASAVSFLSAGLWGYYAVINYRSFKQA